LTRGLKRCCAGAFEVRLERQSWGRPQADERLSLGLRPGNLALIREVFLVCGGKPQVYARSVIPVRTLRGAHRRLASLGSRPLGDVLFADTRTSRRQVQLAQVPVEQMDLLPALRGLPRPTAPLWARRSIFDFSNKSLLIVELFLPDMCGRLSKW
jgi:chorismate--pyruvate lyase